MKKEQQKGFSQNLPQGANGGFTRNEQSHEVMKKEQHKVFSQKTFRRVLMTKVWIKYIVLYYLYLAVGVTTSNS